MKLKPRWCLFVIWWICPKWPFSSGNSWHWNWNLGVFTFPPFLEEQLLHSTILQSQSYRIYIYYILYMWYVISSLKPWHFFLVQGQGRAFSHFSRPSLTPRDGQHPRRLCLWCFSCSVAMNDLQKHEARPILVLRWFFQHGGENPAPFDWPVDPVDFLNHWKYSSIQHTV